MANSNSTLPGFNFDSLVSLVEAYEALESLCVRDSDITAPEFLLLAVLNRQFRAALDRADSAGLLS